MPEFLPPQSPAAVFPVIALYAFGPDAPGAVLEFSLLPSCDGCEFVRPAVYHAYRVAVPVFLPQPAHAHYHLTRQSAAAHFEASVHASDRVDRVAVPVFLPQPALDTSAPALGPYRDDRAVVLEF